MAKGSGAIEHVVVLMLENRSFDQMLGSVPGVEGVLDAGGALRGDLYNLADPTKADSQRFGLNDAAPYAIPTRDVPRSGYGGPSHSFPAATEQLYGSEDGPIALPGGVPQTNAGFVKSYEAELHRVPVKAPSNADVGVVMGGFTQARLPVLQTLAREFCVCDHWFSEVPGPTEPNRLFMHAATSMGFAHNVWTHPITARTIYENLDEAGHDWAFYYYDLSDSNQFPALKKRVDRIHKMDAFFADVASPERLPTYSFLCPRYGNTARARASSEHAPDDVRYGEWLIADVYEALRASEVWTRSLLIVLYDEHGGFYDHVVPPSKGVENPDGLKSPTEYDRKQAERDPKRDGYLLEPHYAFDFTRLGLRVPAVLVSPWVAKGQVLSRPLQHTSVLATVKKLFGLPAFLTRRDAQAATFEDVLDALDAPRTDTPEKLPRPALEATAQADAEALAGQGLSKAQRDVFQSLSHLDGHDDSGRPLEDTGRLDASQQDLARYVDARVESHRRYHERRRAGARFEIYEDRQGEYRWRLRDESGSNIGSSGEGFKTLEEVRQAVAQIRELAGCAAVSLPKVKP